jgi:putative Mg2+ transporter-C (MgtC) family protein
MSAVEFLGGWREILLRLGVATVVGCALGLNREIHAKPAGIRTHGLVCLGSALITLTSFQIAFDGVRLEGSAVLRSVQGVIAGIGFLGGGVIMRDDSQQSVHGLTTAASIWVVACLGISCGAGLWPTTLIAVGLTLTVLIVGGHLERAFRRRFGRPNNEAASPGPDSPA